MSTTDAHVQARADHFAACCQALLDDIIAALGRDYFMKGGHIAFTELVPDGWDGDNAASIVYDRTAFFRDRETGEVVAARQGGEGTSYARLAAGMGEAALPWNRHLQVSPN